MVHCGYRQPSKINAFVSPQFTSIIKSHEAGMTSQRLRGVGLLLKIEWKSNNCHHSKVNKRSEPT